MSDISEAENKYKKEEIFMKYYLKTHNISD